jgi:dihydroflavonol-4-reductase
MAKQRMYYDTAKATNLLGLSPTPVTRALTDAVTWFKEHGYLNISSGRDNGNRT